MIVRSFTNTLALLLLIAQTTSSQEQTEPAPQSEDKVSFEEAVPEKPHRSSRKSRARDVLTIGDNVTIAADDTANDVVVIFGDTEIDGTVTGHVKSILGNVTLGPNAVLERNLLIVAGALKSAPTAKIHGERTVLGPSGTFGFPLPLNWLHGWIGQGLFLGRPIAHQYAWSWAIAGVFLLIYVLLAALFPRPIQATVEALQNRPGGSLFAGFLALLLILPLTVLLIVTVIGVLVVPFLICGFVGAFLLGKVAVYRYAGEQLGHQVGATILEKPLVALVIGVILFYILYTIPFLGIIVWGVIVPLGIGAVLLATFKSYRSIERRPVPVVPIVPVNPSGTIPPLITTTEIPVVAGMPRVGFWPRFLATVLDFVLIGIITLVIFHEAPGVFIPVWVLYHVALWSLKGTTIGGIIVGIKILRLDGTPINWAVAIVRCLAAFLSAVVLFIGFFWASWSADKQAWHDKIAGTVVAKIPKGMSLI